MRTAGALVLAALALGGCGGRKATSSHFTTEPGTVSNGACPVTGRQVALVQLDRASTYTVTARTNLGSFSFRLDVTDSPCTTASFASLVRKGFFDGTVFHRIVPGFVIQGGDPTGTGRGGPGYSVVDTPPSDAQYTKGVVAMAKTGAEPPGAAGSQFFVVTGQNARLTPDYALLGKVTKGLAVVERIGRLGNPQTQQPTRRVVLQQMSVRP